MSESNPLAPKIEQRKGVLPEATFDSMCAEIAAQVEKEKMQGQNQSDMEKTSHFVSANFEFDMSALSEKYLLLWRLAKIPKEDWLPKHIAMYKIACETFLQDMDTTTDKRQKESKYRFIQYVANMIGTLS